MHATKCDTGITLSEDEQIDSLLNDSVLKGDISWTLLRVLLPHCLCQDEAYITYQEQIKMFFMLLQKSFIRNTNLNRISTFFSSQMQIPVYVQYILSLYATRNKKRRSVRTADKPEEVESVTLTTNRM